MTPIFVKFKNQSTFTSLMFVNDPASYFLDENIDMIMIAPDSAEQLSDYDFTQSQEGVWSYELNTERKLQRVVQETEALQQMQLMQQIERQIDITLQRAEQGRRVIAYLSYLNALKDLSIEQTLTLLNNKNLMFIEQCLRTGALETAKLLIEGYAPDGQIITAADKAALLEYLEAKL